MAKYRVWAEMTTDCYLDVEAETPEDAKEIAKETDGGKFTSTESGDWRITDAIEQ